jgi:hypothetical protein
MKTLPLPGRIALASLLFASAAFADTTVPANTTVASGQTYEVVNAGQINTTGAVTIQSGGTALFLGGTAVVLSPGFHVENGGRFRASRDPNTIGLSSLSDSDFDGLPDAWELIYFGSLGATTGAADYDGDGINNAAEYYANDNPLYNQLTPRLSFHVFTPLPQ